MQVGVLFARSNAHPEISFDFLEGLKLAIRHLAERQAITIKAENIGFGGNEKEVYEKAEKLLLIEDVDILIAFIDQRVLPMLEPLMHACGKLLIVVNTGANYPQSWIPQSNIIHLTLNHGYLCWLTGRRAAQAGGNRQAAIATSFYDCGYLHTAAITNGFLKAGGEITHNYVYNRNYENFDIKELADFLSANPRTDSLLCIFDESPAALLYNSLSEFNNAKELRLFVSPMMLEPKALSALTDGCPFTVMGYLPWQKGQVNESNQKFVATYHNKTGKDPGIFAVLGWECGLILDWSCAQNSLVPSNGDALATQLKEVTIDSPRGPLRLDRETNFFAGPFHEVSVTSNIIQVKEMDVSPGDWNEFTADTIKGVVSGWTNTYLCY